MYNVKNFKIVIDDDIIFIKKKLILKNLLLTLLFTVKIKIKNHELVM